MRSGIPRWSWLAIFAACNLAFWLTVAVSVALVASDRVDLGIESFLREKQATVVAAQTRVPGRRSSPTPPATAVAAIEATDNPSVGQEPPTSAPQPTTALPTSDLRMTPYDAGSQMTPYATRTPSAPPLPKPTAKPAGTAGSDSKTEEAEPTPIPASSPLLLADPDMTDLASMDAELRHSASGRPVQIRYGEEALNREVEALLVSYPDLPIRNVEVDLQRGRVSVNGDATIMGLEMDTTVEGTVVAQDCRPQVVIESVSIGSFLTPAFIKEEVARMIQDSVASYPDDYPLCLEQIVLEEDRVTLYGTRR